MPVDPARVGTVVAGETSHLVGRDAVVAFARAVAVGVEPDPASTDPAAARALGHADVVAPPTFAVSVTQAAEAAFVLDPASGVDFPRVVHGEQRLVHHRPITAGDRLVTSVVLDALRTMAGSELVMLRSEVTDEAGAPVCTATSMLVVRAPGPPADDGHDGAAGVPS